ncbi:Threonine--tRNA ligase, cytoplasmic [Yarrowia sp. C11]|nr:Threonine--tRNA ligase, cytoplasmic [Yarrowia sp. C11]
MAELVDKMKEVVLGDKPAEQAPAKDAKPAKEKKAADPSKFGQAKQKKTKAPKDGEAASSRALELDPKPEFLDSRIKMFDELKVEYDAFVAAQERKPIVVTLKDGTPKEATAWETSPMDICKTISKSLPDQTVIAKVNGELWDMERPLEGDAKLEFLDFNSDEGKRVFWHSSAHVLGEATERHYGAHLCIGPPTEDGFFYEMSIDNGDTHVQACDYDPLETVAKSAIKDKQKFERLVLSKENLLKMFAYNKYKVELIQKKIPDGTSTTVYRCGPLIDLCVGPHIPHTGKIKAFKLLKNSSSYFLGDKDNDSLQRIFGISFPDKKLMTEHLKFLEEAAKRDHRKIGREQELFLFNDMSPGSCFWLPHGARIYSALTDLLRKEYRKRGYEEVITPNMYNSKLWETSGHWQNYKDDMFTFEIEKEKFGLKPMNCPGHCLMFKARDRSYKELPWRVADFGVIHRNEASGALTGLTRVRRFQQDDAHIFCMPSQIQSEITGIFDFLKKIYTIFGFEFKMKLSTRPDKYVGEIETWNDAEKQLEEALNKWGANWELNPGDGAFYGPKIDIVISDALHRWHQCATIQLDFQLPNRFDLNFKNSAAMGEGEADSAALYTRPVMIHRAIYGSFERMTAILCEHFAGKWPFWLSPRQVLVIPVGPKYNDYAQEVRDELVDAGFFADVDNGPNTLQKKVREAQLKQYNFTFIVGEEEKTAKSVNIRDRDDQSKQAKAASIPLDEVISRLHKLKDSKALAQAGVLV